MAAWTGKQTTKPEGTEVRLPHNSDNKYFPWEYTHSPKSWEVCEVEDLETGETSFQVLPVLKVLNWAPGQRGVKTGPRGSKVADMSLAHQLLRDQGVVRIPVDAFPGGYYVEGAGVRGTVFASVFDSVDVLSPTECHWTYNSPSSPAMVDHDTDWNQWRAELVATGVIQPATPAVLDLLARRLKARAGKASTLSVKIPNFKPEADKATAKLEVLNKVQAEHVAAARAARAAKPPARKRRSRAKTSTGEE